MAGILPADVEMCDRYQALNHVELEAIGDTPTARAGESIRGHEFHYSKATVDNDASLDLKRFAERESTATATACLNTTQWGHTPTSTPRVGRSVGSSTNCRVDLLQPFLEKRGVGRGDAFDFKNAIADYITKRITVLGPNFGHQHVVTRRRVQ